MRPNLHIFGLQGSGKDTQAAKLAQRFQLAHLSSGALFRARMELADTVGVFMSKEIHAGHLLPDEFLVQAVENALHNLPTEQGIICAGILRTPNQQRLLQPTWKEYEFEVPFGIVLDVNEETAKQRALARNRSDDTPQALQERFQLFHTQTEPVLEQLEHQHHLVRINGDQGIEEVFSDICKALESHRSLHHVAH